MKLLLTLVVFLSVLSSCTHRHYSHLTRRTQPTQRVYNEHGSVLSSGEMQQHVNTMRPKSSPDVTFTWNAPKGLHVRLLTFPVESLDHKMDEVISNEEVSPDREQETTAPAKTHGMPALVWLVVVIAFLTLLGLSMKWILAILLLLLVGGFLYVLIAAMAS